jgi:putative transposase
MWMPRSDWPPPPRHRDRPDRSDQPAALPVDKPDPIGRPYPDPNTRLLTVLDFVSDSLANGRWFRILTVVDVCTRECVAIQVATSLTASDVTTALDAAIARRAKPQLLTTDNGSEFTSRHFDAWAFGHKIGLDFIRPGKPVENGYIESFNGKLRDECLNSNWFQSVDEAREVIEAWARDYNEARPHSSLGNQTPTEYVEALLGRSAAQITISNN